jgi:hypothetical protein
MSAHEDSRLVDECIELRQIIAKLGAENRELRNEIAVLRADVPRLRERWLAEMGERAQAFISAEIGPGVRDD